MSNALERHSLVWLNAAGWDAAIAAARPEHVAGLARWRQHDWPAIVRRKDADTSPATNPPTNPLARALVDPVAGSVVCSVAGAVANPVAGAVVSPGISPGADAIGDVDARAVSGDISLGVPLPPDAAGIKVRIPLRVAVSHVARTSAPLELRAALPTADAWHDSLAALCDAAPSLRVFGSLAMQALTGLRYVSPTSDVDLLFHPSSRRQLEDVVALLARHAERLPLDGEIVFPGGAAVSWKEWLMATRHPAKVMVKELRSVRLADTASLLATLEAT